MDSGLFFNIFVFLAASCGAVLLASRFRLGSVLGYLIAGIFIGPYGLGLIEDAQRIMHFAEFGVVMMLFVIGLELEPDMLWRLRKAIVVTGGLQVALSSMAFTVIGVVLGYSWQLSLAASMALSLSSTALVLQMLEERHLTHTAMGETSLSVLLFQDIAVIPILILMPLLATHSVPVDDGSAIAHWPGWAQALVVGAVIAAVIAAGRYLSHHLFRLVAKTELRELFTALALALVVGVTLLMKCVGVSPALGAFVAGVVLANSPYRRTLEADLEPFKGLLLGLFFISVGMGMDFNLLAHSPLRLLATVAVLICVKVAILLALGRTAGLTAMHNYGFALALSQGGEFAFVLFQFAFGLHLMEAGQMQFLTLAVALSMATTPLLMVFYNRRIVPRFMSLLPEHEFDTVEERNPVIIAGFGRFGQVIGRFLMGQGIRTTVLEKDADQIELLRRFGIKSYFGDASRMDFLHSAGAKKAHLLIIAVDDAEVSLEIASMAREEFPNLKVFARARNRRHAYELHKLGVAYFKRETFDSALDMAQEIMTFLGKDAAEMKRKAAQFKQHDEQTLRESFGFFDNEPQLVNYTRTRREELERILQSDTKAPAA